LTNYWDVPSDEIVEKIFGNKISENKIYYTGVLYRGKGTFWVYANDEKLIVLDTDIRYGPMIKWHGEHLAEIYIPTGSPFRHSYFLDFRDNFLSDAYGFIIYVDKDYDNIIELGDGCLNMFNLRNNTLIKRFVFNKIFVEKYFAEEHGQEVFAYRLISANELLINGKYDIQKINRNTLIIKYDIKSSDHETSGEFVYEY
jgi:hypothetical protein